MPEGLRPTEEPLFDVTPVADESPILATQEVAAVKSHKREECGLALRVAKGLEGIDRTRLHQALDFRALGARETQ